MVISTLPRRRCTIHGCPRGHRARGLCARHYSQARNRGQLPPLSPRPAACVTCGDAVTWGGHCAEHQPSTPDPSPRSIAKPLHCRTRKSAPKQVERAREILAVTTDPEVARILRARIDNPTATLATIGAALGLSQAAYWSRLRRAMRTPEQVERERQYSTQWETNRVYRLPHGSAGYIGSCMHHSCGARWRTDRGRAQPRHFYIGDEPCIHVAALHPGGCPAAQGGDCVGGCELPDIDRSVLL